MLCQFQIYSKVYQLYIYICPLFQILFPYMPLQSIEQSSLCYPVGPYQLSLFFLKKVIFLWLLFFSFFFFKELLYLSIYLFLAVLGLCFCARAFSSCGKRGPLFITVHGPLTTVASLVAEHRLQTRRLSSCGSRAQLLRGMWDLPRPGLEPVSPALAGRFSTTVPPGKPQLSIFYIVVCICQSQSSNLSPSYPLVTISLFSTSVTLYLFCR